MTTDPTPPDRPGRLDHVLAVLIVILGFLIASTAARNSDLWFHLATGRALSDGSYRLGEDPFRFPTGTAWVNHAWLFDLGTFATHAVAGGPGLIVVKALLVAAMAGLMIGPRRGGSGAAALCALPALLAMGPRLAALQPAVGSFFLLGLTLWLLERLRRRPEGRWRFVPLLLAIALWANVDAWFVLGPILVLLFSAGESVRAWRQGRPSPLPVWLIPAAVAVCLLNPHGLGVFALPPELSPVLADSGLGDDPRFRAGLASPWEHGVRLAPAAAVSLADCAFFLLVALGLLSFVLVFWPRRGEQAPPPAEGCGPAVVRLLVWLALGTLGSLQLRLVPFFAVVAGPIAAWNFQDWYRRRAADPGRATTVGKSALLTLGLALTLLVALGWHRGLYVEGRRMAWDVVEDPSLRRAAETVRAWRQRGQDGLGEGEHGFAFHPDVAHYLAWFCPGERSFFDHRLTLDATAARDYERVCRDLAPILTGGDEPSGEGWRDVFREHGISFVLLYDPDVRLLAAALDGLVRRPGEWRVVRVDGQVVLVGWREAYRGPADRPELLAFGTAGEAVVAPDRGPGRAPRLRPFWERPFEAITYRSWESPAATAYSRWFDSQRELAAGRYWATLTAGFLGQAALPDPVGVRAPNLILRLRSPALFTERPAPPATLPLLAIRSARTALARQPDDVNASLYLGKGYLALSAAAPEAGGQHGVLLDGLRAVQTATALEQALIVDPDLAEAHAELSDLYIRRNYLDAAVDHRRALARIARTGKQDRRGKEALRLLEDQLKRLEGEVQDRQHQFLIRVRSIPDAPLEHAQLALQLGLARKALDEILLTSNPQLFGPEGARLQLELMLTLGRAHPAGELLRSEEVKKGAEKLRSMLIPTFLPGASPGAGPGFGLVKEYDWLVLLQAAAVGDYESAGATLADMLHFLEQDERMNLPLLRKGLAKMLMTELGVSAPWRQILASGVARQEREALTGDINLALRQRATRVELHLLAGVLALEQGLTTLADEHLRQVATMSRGPLAAGVSPGIPSLAEGYSRLLQAHKKQ